MMMAPVAYTPLAILARSTRDKAKNLLWGGIVSRKNLEAKWSKSILEEIRMFKERDFVLIIIGGIKIVL